MEHGMAGHRIKLVLRPDFIRRLSNAGAIEALVELIWNSFDEDARTVEVRVTATKLDGVECIEIADDGNSRTPDTAEQAFSQLGGSDKRNRTLESGEALHGRHNQGRFKAFSLG